MGRGLTAAIISAMLTACVSADATPPPKPSSIASGTVLEQDGRGSGMSKSLTFSGVWALHAVWDCPPGEAANSFLGRVLRPDATIGARSPATVNAQEDVVLVEPGTYFVRITSADECTWHLTAKASG